MRVNTDAVRLLGRGAGELAPSSSESTSDSSCIDSCGLCIVLILNGDEDVAGTGEDVTGEDGFGRVKLGCL